MADNDSDTPTSFKASRRPFYGCKARDKEKHCVGEDDAIMLNSDISVGNDSDIDPDFVIEKCQVSVDSIESTSGDDDSAGDRPSGSGVEDGSGVGGTSGGGDSGVQATRGRTRVREARITTSWIMMTLPGSPPGSKLCKTPTDLSVDDLGPKWINSHKTNSSKFGCCCW